MAEDQPDPHNLLPLGLACELVLAKVYADRLSGLNKEEILDSIASTIATVAPIYEYSPKAPAATRKLTTAELADGRFRGGGRQLSYPDGRQPRTSLAVSVKDIETVVERLKQRP
jgi:hypothetical protein